MTLLTRTPNFRDVGGVPTVGGGSVRRGMLFRSETVIDPTDEDATALRAKGIVLVCDLRSATERDHAPNAWWATNGVERLPLDILADIRGSPEAWAVMKADPSVAGALRVMNTIYRELPTAAAPHLAVIFDRIAGGDVPLLIHCTAGKDRTGFVVAMILHALGVSFDDIVADYMLSGGRANARVVDHTRRMIRDRVGPDVGEEAIGALIGVDRGYLQTSFARMAADYGSVDGYLQTAVGTSSDTLQAVRKRLIE